VVFGGDTDVIQKFVQVRFSTAYIKDAAPLKLTDLNKGFETHSLSEVAFPSERIYGVSEFFCGLGKKIFYYLFVFFHFKIEFLPIS